MRRILAILLPLFSVLGILLAVSGDIAPRAYGQAAKEDCTVLECPRCQTMCRLLCDHEAAACTKSGARNCPRNARSCARNCPAQFCRQCMADQFDAKGKRFVQGPTRICQSPARWQ